MEGKKFLFVCGLHRSGTSILFKILRDHPQISGFEGTGVAEDEGQHLQTVYPPAKVFGGPGLFGFKPASFLDETSPLVTEENGRKLYEEWMRYWDAEAPILMEKSPPNLVRTRFLQALFPESWFVVILRHPLAVAYATRKWSKTRIKSLVEHWLLCHERFESDRERLRRLLVLKYEDFVVNPQEVLDRICAFIDAPAVPVGRDVRPDVNGKYFDEWARMRRGFVTRFETRKIVRSFEARARRCGYSRDAPGEAVPGYPA